MRARALRDRVQAAAFLAAPGQAHIERAGTECPLERGALERRAAHFERRLQLLLRLVDARARGRPLGRRQRAERLQLLGEGALLAKPAHAHVLERGQVAAAGDLDQCPVGEGPEVRHDLPLSGQVMPRAVLACCASAPNAAVSCTAMSASTLRSISTPALPRPLMMRL